MFCSLHHFTCHGFLPRVRIDRMSAGTWQLRAGSLVHTSLNGAHAIFVPFSLVPLAAELSYQGDCFCQCPVFLQPWGCHASVSSPWSGLASEPVSCKLVGLPRHCRVSHELTWCATVLNADALFSTESGQGRNRGYLGFGLCPRGAVFLCIPEIFECSQQAQY